MSLLHVTIQKDEYWWGGTTMHAYAPIHRNTVLRLDFRVNAPNQTMPFLVSTLGRYIFSEEPFALSVENGVITLEGGDFILDESSDTLKNAYLLAQARHFCCDKKELEKLFFTVPQYNSWIEFAYYPTQEGILKYARDILSHGYQPGIFIIDEGWHIHTGYGRWEFDFARFPDPKQMVFELHELGFKVMLWITPFVTPVGPDYVRSIKPYIGTDPESAKHLYKRTVNNEIALVKWWNGVAAILDLTNPYDFDFLDKQLKHLQQAYGIDGFKFDGGALHHYQNQNVINGELSSTPTPAQMNAAWNAFGTRFAFHEYKDTFKGGGKNCIQRLHDRDHSWVGNGINELIPCAINKGLLGYPFTCPDMVGGGEWSNRYTPGFQVDEELFVRMAQCSALFPMMQFSWAPWEALSKENERYCLAAAKLHEAFAPVILELVKSAEQTGEPMIRCLEYNDPHKGYQHITDEFMLGEDILVAPVVTKNTFERSVTFPTGNWRAPNGVIYPGNTKQVLPCPLDTLLYFQRVPANSEFMKKNGETYG